jgi:hypothetical protein
MGLDRRRRRGAASASEPDGRQGDDRLTLLLTEFGGRITHLVTDDQVAGLLDGRLPRSLCGRTFIPAALVAPFGTACHACSACARPP